MSIGTAKTLDHKDLRGDLYACACRFPSQNRSRMDSGNLASATHYRHHRRCHHHRVPHLEAQT